jgi:hypothetical protein
MNPAAVPVVHLRNALATALVLLQAAACGESAAARRNGGDGLEAAPALHLSLLTTSPENLDLTTVTGLAADTRGNLYLADFPSLRVIVLSAAGEPLRIFGRRGGGPAEFQFIRSLQLLAGDSLLVYDEGQNRVTVFPPASDSAAYTLNLAVTTGLAPPYQLHRLPGSGGFIAAYTRPFQPSDNPHDDAARHATLRLLDSAGRVRRDSVLLLPGESYLVARNPGRVAVAVSPFGRRSVFDVGVDGRVYHGSGDSSMVSVYSPEGRRVAGFRIPWRPEAVTREQVDTLAQAMGQAFSRTVHTNAPETWGSVHRLMVDGRTVWVEQGGTRRRLIALDGAGRVTGVVDLPPDFEPRLVRGGRLYGVHKSLDGVSRVLVYRLDPPTGGAAPTGGMRKGAAERSTVEQRNPSRTPAFHFQQVSEP